MDILARHQRLLGWDVLWQMGTDHAGIAAQMMVERALLKEGKTRNSLGREAFSERMWAWKETCHSRHYRADSGFGRFCGLERRGFHHG